MGWGAEIFYVARSITVRVTCPLVPASIWVGSDESLCRTLHYGTRDLSPCTSVKVIQGTRPPVPTPVPKLAAKPFCDVFCKVRND